jgi:hypothetical protein
LEKKPWEVAQLSLLLLKEAGEECFFGAAVFSWLAAAYYCDT